MLVFGMMNKFNSNLGLLQIDGINSDFIFMYKCRKVRQEGLVH